MFVSKKIIPLSLILIFLLLNSCEKFFDPSQDLVIETEDYFKDWAEYRSAEMGLYALQQELTDQIIILGELRGDLMEITNNADRDLSEIYNFQISNDNIYASPINFYKLIGACNSLIRELETNHTEVFNDEDPTDYDRLYGEVKCMRAWAYFNAVRIYGKIPYIWEELTSADEIVAYVNSGGNYIDSVDIIFDDGGYYNDTIYNTPVSLERTFLDMDMVIDTFTMELENDIKPYGVGVIHNMDNFDLTWDITIWNNYAYRCLLGQMYLYQGDYVKAEENFRTILYNYDSETSYIKFGLDNKFSFSKWKNIFSGIDGDEHIFTLWFGKSYQQQHNLQSYFSKVSPNKYMIKPTSLAVSKWETIWDGVDIIRDDSQPEETYVREYGDPGDFSRGYGISYVYMDGNEIMEAADVKEMLLLKKRRLLKDVENLMAGKDTVLYKYTYGKQAYDQDANIIIYRAASIHLYTAEIYNRWEWDHDGVIMPELNESLKIVNNGSYDNNTDQLGVRGRAGFGDGDDAIQVSNIIYDMDPTTNEITGYHTLDDIVAKQEYIEDQIVEERARELAFEGERFYDLMRIAKRRNDPSFLADRVAEKFSGSKKEQIRAILMNEENWYVPFFE